MGKERTDLETLLFDNLQRQNPFRWLLNIKIKDAGGDKISVGV